MNADAHGLAREYESALRAYVTGGGEDPLRRAYDLGRRALDDGLGVLHVATLHREAVQTILSDPPGQATRTVKAAEVFFAECLSPFEMVHRGFREANAALRSAGRLQILHELDRAILAAQSPEGIAQAALQRMHQLAPCHQASVLLFDLEVQEATVLAAHATGDTKLRPGTRLPLEAFDVGNLHLLGQGKIHVVEDLHALSQVAPVMHTLKAEGLRSYTTVPLRTQGRLIGALTLGASRPGPFPAEHVEIAREVADLLAVAIQHARIYEQVQRHAVALQYQATHDGLTDLPNRLLLHDRLRQALLAGQRAQRPVALLILDLDQFKAINDTFGHPSGDLLLKQIGPRLRGALRHSDTLARLGGDEFVVLLPHTDAEGATLVAQKILAVLAQPFPVEGQALTIGTSIGIALFPQHGTDADSLMRHADVALYLAKQGRGKYAIYSPDKDPGEPR